MARVSAKKRVLIATKEEALRGFDAAICHAHGFETLHARWGDEALELYRQNRPIVLIVTDLLYDWSDWRLAMRGNGQSVKNGIQLAVAVRKLSRKQKVLIHTYAPADQVRAHLNLEGVVVLQKPFRPEELGEYLDHL
jgi:DNA-binding response OmpR family regulator